MQRVGFMLKVKPEHVAEYKRHHENVWPEMQAALSRAGWHNYSLFIRPDGLVFGYVEVVETFEQAIANMGREPINEKWQEFMAPFFEGVPGTHADQMMETLEPYFYLA
ncbi:MAG: L-rhamnose mutarotase [Anaerolineales bacterium]|nr:L-rhamnose mutarotase [Anaerolineales bacterium]